MLFAGLLALTGASAFVPATRPAAFGVQQQRAAAPSMQFGNFFQDDRSDLEVKHGSIKRRICPSLRSPSVSAHLLWLSLLPLTEVL